MNKVNCISGVLHYDWLSVSIRGNINIRCIAELFTYERCDMQLKNKKQTNRQTKKKEN